MDILKAVSASRKRTSIFILSMLNRKPNHPEPGDEAMSQSARSRGSESKEDRAERRAKLRADGLLAKRCLAGEVAAWEEIYAQCHEPLLVSISIMLDPKYSDASLVDEIAARVWYALVANDGELLARYKPKRGARLITFLRALAKDEIVRHIRSEVRRRNREVASLRVRPKHLGQDDSQSSNILGEFFGTLTQSEKIFCSNYLLAAPADAVDQTYTKANVWQLSHRIRRKLNHFFNQDQQ